MFSTELGGLEVEKYFFKEDEPCFEAFKEDAKQMGYEIVFVRMIKRSDSGWCLTSTGSPRTIPHMQVYVVGRAAYENMKAAQGGISDVNAVAKEKLLGMWKQICTQYGENLIECYDKDMALNFERVENILYKQFAGQHKPIEEEVRRILGCPPWQIYDGGRTPALHLLFDVARYKNNDVENKKEMLEDSIRVLARRTILELTGQDDIEDVLEIRFWTPEMPGYEEMNFGWRWYY